MVALVMIAHQLRGGHTPAPKASLRNHLARRIHIEPLIYRRHRIVGCALLIASVAWLWLLSPLHAWQIFLKTTWHYIKQVAVNGDLPTLIATILGACAFVVGLILIIRPSLLRPFESRFNKLAHKDPMRGDVDSPTTRS